MTVRIRETTDEDAPAHVAIVREVMPHMPVTVESLHHRWRSAPERARRLWLTAEWDGVVVGRGESGFDWFGGGVGVVALAVASSARRRGVGTALYERLDDHLRALGARRTLTMFYETPEGVRFAEQRGFREARGEVPSIVDPREVGVTPPAGIDVVPVGEVPPEQIHAVDEAATRDVPLTEPVEAIPFEEWMDQVWNVPTFTRDGSYAVVADGRAVSVSILFADLEGHRAVNAFTGTLREYRGRGYALAAKVAALRWAAANGITVVATTNDERNAAMLAINRRLGYRPAGRMVEYLRDG